MATHLIKSGFEKGSVAVSQLPRFTFNGSGVRVKFFQIALKSRARISPWEKALQNQMESRIILSNGFIIPLDNQLASWLSRYARFVGYTTYYH